MARVVQLFCSTMLISLAFAVQLRAQDTEVIFKFEVDGKPVHQKFKVQLEVDGKIVEAKRGPNGFYVPAELLACGKCEIFSVRFTSMKYVLAFDGVYRKDLASNWVIGIDNAPLDSDNMNISFSYNNVRKLHYLGFRPRNGEIATRITVLYPVKK